MCKDCNNGQDEKGLAMPRCPTCVWWAVTLTDTDRDFLRTMRIDPR